MAEFREIKVPDIGGASGVDVIEILVKEGDSIQVDTPLLTLESDKASMEIPSPAAGIVQSLKVKLADKLSEGDVILLLSTDAAQPAEPAKPLAEPEVVVSSEPAVEAAPPVAAAPKPDLASSLTTPELGHSVHAGPAVRRLAREFGVSLDQVTGSGPKARITKEDLQAYVKSRLQSAATGSAFSLPQAPNIDFSRFGPVEAKPLNKIKRATAANLHRAWLTVPHVTQFDEADITELEAFRLAQTAEQKSQDYKLTILAFVCKVVANALKAFPQFNSSLDPSGENLIYKQYVNIGVAVETENGLVVPVIKAVDSLSVIEIAKALAKLSAKAREKALTPVDMSGACFTISSLGGIGGTAFTPIVNSPEVAILGLSRSSMKPVYLQGEFQPRLMLPLSLSYDHRVIDGAEAARFTRYLALALADLRRILL